MAPEIPVNGTLYGKDFADLMKGFETGDYPGGS